MQVHAEEASINAVRKTETLISVEGILLPEDTVLLFSKVVWKRYLPGCSGLCLETYVSGVLISSAFIRDGVGLPKEGVSSCWKRDTNAAGSVGSRKLLCFNKFN